MKSSYLLNDVFSAGIRKLGSVLATGTLAVCLLLGTSAAQAAIVKTSGDDDEIAEAIFNLEVNGRTFNVDFRHGSANDVFDFDNEADAQAANDAIIAALNEHPDSEITLAGGAFSRNNSNQYGIPFAATNDSVDIAVGRYDNPVAGDWGNAGVDSVLADAELVYAVFIEDSPAGNQPPAADAGGPYTGTAGVAVAFDGGASGDPDGTIDTYDWDYGDGATDLDAGPTPSHTYADGGTYNVILTVTDDGGTTNSDTTTATIGAASQPPAADAGGPYTGTEGVSLSFDGSASDDPDGDIVQYDWDFGDGNIAIDGGPSPSNTYVSSGTYTVTLTVRDNDGETDTDMTTATIAVGNQPPVADAGPPAVGTVGVAVDFDGSASGDPDGTIDTYDWDYGDGATDLDAGPTPSHTYAAPGDYTVILTVTDDDDATDSNTTAASIDSAAIPPVADANGPYQGTTDVNIEFDGSSSSDADGSIARYDWDFGDGSGAIDAGPTPGHTYLASGTYNVTLTVTDDDDLTDTTTTTASIASGNQPPVADAGGPYTGVEDVSIDVDASASSDPDGTIVGYLFDWGDGISTSSLNPLVSHTYVDPGIYTITVTVEDDDGLSDTSTTTADIADDGNQPPSADADGPYTGTVGVPVQFDSSGSSDPDDGILDYVWNFGDGSPESDDANPTHIYTAPGNYIVSLRVFDGANSSMDYTIANIDEPNEAPMADANGPYAGKVGVPVDFDGSASSDPDGSIEQYDWDFGDGNTAIDAGSTPSNTYAAAGTYEVVLTVTDDAGDSASDATLAIIGDGINLPPTADAGGPYTGDEGVAVNFDGSASDDPDGTIATYDWDWGDGNVDLDAGPTPQHTYATAGVYPVTLTVTDDGGDTDTDVTVAAIGMGNQPPVSDANGPYAGAVDVPIQFDGTGSDDPDGQLVSAQWDFGDGNIGSGLIPTHTYTASGPYTAVLVVEDNEGATDRSTAQVIIGDGLQLPPTADADGPYAGVAGVPVTFDGSGSTDPDGTITAYVWDFGDDNTDTGEMSDNTYGASGVYNVILEVTDDDSLTASDSTLALIGELSVPPTADANGPYNGSVGNAVTFDGTGSSDPDGTIERYDWAFGDGTIAMDAGPTPTYTYAADGKYIVRLTVTDDSGETDEDVTTATIGIGNLPPTADAGDAVTGRVRRTVTFDGTDSRDPDGIITDYDWDFGDGNIGNGPTPNHVYNAPGTYFVTLTVTDNDGKTASDFTLAVTRGAGSDGSGDDFLGCSTGSHKVKDPVLPLFVLLSVIYLIRRRMAHVSRVGDMFPKNNLHGDRS